MKFFYGCVVSVVLFGCSDQGSLRSAPETEPTHRVKRGSKQGGNAGGRQGSKKTSDESASLGASVERIQASHDLHSAEFDSFFTDRGASCPPHRFSVDHRQIEFNPVSDMVGSDTTVLVARDRSLVVKTLAALPQGSATKKLFEALSMERAVHEVIGNLDGYSVAMHAIDGNELTPGCLVATTVSDFGGDYNLDALVGKLNGRHKDLAKIAARAVRILRAVHDRGIVHGDVHKKNFVLADLANPAASLKIIDFGRAAPFVDINGVHIANRRMHSSGWNLALLSPWELEDSRLSRRDDMYRLSELLLRLVNAGPLKAAGIGGNSRTQVLGIKRRRFAGPAELTEFHQAMLLLQFDEKPDYSKWIRRFTAAAARGSLN